MMTMIAGCWCATRSHECKLSNSVIEARDGKEAIDLLKGRRPARRHAAAGADLSDIEMPGMDGQTTLKHIKSDPELRDIPVVMMTGVRTKRKCAPLPPTGQQLHHQTGQCEQFLRTVLASTNYWLTIHQYPHRGARSMCADEISRFAQAVAARVDEKLPIAVVGVEDVSHVLSGGRKRSPESAKRRARK